MEKKILAILCIIAFVILYILPVIIAGIILTGIFMGCFTFYKKPVFALFLLYYFTKVRNSQE